MIQSECELVKRKNSSPCKEEECMKSKIWISIRIVKEGRKPMRSIVILVKRPLLKYKYHTEIMTYERIQNVNSETKNKQYKS